MRLKAGLARSMPMLLKACVRHHLVRAGRTAWHEAGSLATGLDVSCDQRVPAFVPAAAGRDPAEPAD
jgi:hypothetical protein